jgi:hypothetical protein
MRVLISVCLAAALCAAILSGCSDECTNPDLTGHIRVSLNVSGSESAAGEYTVTLDDAVTDTISTDKPVVLSNLDV